MTRIGTLVPFVFAVFCCNSAPGQAPAATALYVELQNVVEYQVDVSDLSKWGTNPNITRGGIAQGTGVGCVGVPIVGYGDIVSVKWPAREGHIHGPRNGGLYEFKS